MGWTRVNGVYIKDGFYLEPISPTPLYQDAGILTKVMLLDRYLEYAKNPPLLMPLLRGGTGPFLPMSGSFRAALNNGSIKVDYKGIKTSRYAESEIGQIKNTEIDDRDIETALRMLETRSEGIIIDDVHDEGVSAWDVENRLAISGKPIKLATLYRKSERRKVSREPDYCVRDFLSREIGGVVYPPWVVFPWESDDHEPELWYALFPEFTGLHPKDYLAGMQPASSQAV